MNGAEALNRLLDDYPDIRSVLDIGCGDGEHAAAMRDAGKCVTTISLRQPADVVADYVGHRFDQPFDAIWACAVLEHQPNVGVFLRRCFDDLRDDGVFAVTVPPLKHAIVGGHLTLWNAGLLLYNMILAGFDCRQARVNAYGYNISAIVRKARAEVPPLAFDAGDIERVARFFPVRVEHGFDGRLRAINW